MLECWNAGVLECLNGGLVRGFRWGIGGVYLVVEGESWTESLFPDTHVVSARRINLGVTTNIHT
jgi:hypothetical protein